MISSLSALLASRLLVALLRFGEGTLTGGFFFILFADCRRRSHALV
jgi:hypothetical protein